MAVFRVERNTGYTVMSNHHLRNKELSLKAKGLLSQRQHGKHHAQCRCARSNAAFYQKEQRQSDCHRRAETN